MENSAVLVLADGSTFEGVSVGASGYTCGEVVFNTAQSGYQEIMTDPSYNQQIVVFTQPHIGNTGVNQEDMESHQAWIAGAVMHSVSGMTNHWRAQQSLADFLKQQEIIAISDIDTRALTHHLREHGSQAGCIMTGKIQFNKALEYAKDFPSLTGKDLAQMVTTQQAYQWNKGSFFNKDNHPSAHVVVYDFGVKNSILRALVDVGCHLTVVPAKTSYQDVLALRPDGVVLSNGPGDPAACGYAIEATKGLLNQAIPIMAICLGHQILALASGAKTKKMTLGHHGANHPVQCHKTGKVAISSQNHGFVIDEESLPNHLRVTTRSLFDGTIAGIEHTDVPAFGFQGHPEAGPGPTELTLLFDQFVSLMGECDAKK